MEQRDLFAVPLTTNIFEAAAETRRDRGMARSADHAERVSPEWQERAVGYVKRYASEHSQFLCEHVRAVAEVEGLAAPPDKRAWGAAMIVAAKRGIVKSCGYAPAQSSNLSPKVQWRSLIIGVI